MQQHRRRRRYITVERSERGGPLHDARTKELTAVEVGLGARAQLALEPFQHRLDEEVRVILAGEVANLAEEGVRPHVRPLGVEPLVQEGGVLDVPIVPAPAFVAAEPVSASSSSPAAAPGPQKAREGAPPGVRTTR